MKFAFAVVALATLAFAPVANAADLSLKDCTALSKQVSAALDAAQPGEAKDAARSEASNGRNMCTMRLFAQGVAHYSRALQLLGKS